MSRILHLGGEDWRADLLPCIAIASSVVRIMARICSPRHSVLHLQTTCGSCSVPPQKRSVAQRQWLSCEHYLNEATNQTHRGPCRLWRAAPLPPRCRLRLALPTKCMPPHAYNALPWAAPSNQPEDDANCSAATNSCVKAPHADKAHWRVWTLGGSSFIVFSSVCPKQH